MCACMPPVTDYTERYSASKSLPAYRKYVKATQNAAVRWDAAEPNPHSIEGLCADQLLACIAIVIHGTNGRISMIHTDLAFHAAAVCNEVMWVLGNNSGDHCVSMYVIRGQQYVDQSLPFVRSFNQLTWPRLSTAIAQLAQVTDCSITLPTEFPITLSGAVAVQLDGSITLLSPPPRANKIIRIGQCAPEIENRHSINMLNHNFLAIQQSYHTLDIQFDNDWTSTPSIIEALVSQIDKQKKRQRPLDELSQYLVDYCWYSVKSK